MGEQERDEIPLGHVKLELYLDSQSQTRMRFSVSEEMNKLQVLGMLETFKFRLLNGDR